MNDCIALDSGYLCIFYILLLPSPFGCSFDSLAATQKTSCFPYFAIVQAIKNDTH